MRSVVHKYINIYVDTEWNQEVCGMLHDPNIYAIIQFQIKLINKVRDISLCALNLQPIHKNCIIEFKLDIRSLESIILSTLKCSQYWAPILSSHTHVS